MMRDKDFWTGISLVVSGLADASKQASYSIGFGAGGLGLSMLILKHFQVAGIELTLISMSAFFVTARLGRALDEINERALMKAKLEHDIELQKLKNIIDDDNSKIKIISGK